MRYLDLTLPTLAENLALDEALLLDAESGGPEMLRLWESPFFGVVVGAGGKVAAEVNLDACRRDGIPLARRSSGGGTVLVGPGCLMFSLVLSFERHPALAEIRPSYCFILGLLARTLSRPGAAVTCAGTSDLAVDGQKVSGNSQQRKRRHLLHHGTLLYNFAMADMGRYLPPPPRQPEYRGQRSHHEFLANLVIGAAELKLLLRDAWQANELSSGWPRDPVAKLVSEKYKRDEWTLRR